MDKEIMLFDSTINGWRFSNKSKEVYISSIMIDRVSKTYNGNKFVRVMGVGLINNLNNEDKYMGLTIHDTVIFMKEIGITEINKSGITLTLEVGKNLDTILNIKLNKEADNSMLFNVKDNFVIKNIVDVKINGNNKDCYYVTGDYASYTSGDKNNPTEEEWRQSLKRYPTFDSTCKLMSDVNTFDEIKPEFIKLLEDIREDIKSELIDKDSMLAVDSVIDRYINKSCSVSIN